MSERYDYMEAMVSDIKDYILENYSSLADRDTAEQKLYDDLWVIDSVTGNASGSYTSSSWKAEEYLCHNLDLLGDAFFDFGTDTSRVLQYGPEACDVTIRCYLLGAALCRALDELEADGEITYEGDEEL